MEKIILVKDDKRVEIDVRRYRGIYLFPLAYIIKRKLWNQIFPSIATTILIFPAFMHRIWLVNSIWEEQTRTLLDKGYQPWDEDSYEVLKKHTIVPSLEYLDTERFVYITNGNVMRQIQTKAPKGMKEWISFYNQAWENKMYWIGFTSAFMLITGLGDVVFSFVALSRGGKWQWNKWSKKGYKPYTNVDRIKIENDELKRSYEEVGEELEKDLKERE